MAFPATPLDVEVSLALGADLTADSGTWAWTDVTGYVHAEAGITISRGRPNEFSSAPASVLTLQLDNSDGRFCMRNPTGAYFGQLSRNTPIRVRVDPGGGEVSRYIGFVDQWPPRWDPSLNFRYAPITASGVLRRLDQGQAARSALYRAHAIQLYSAASAPRAYWPCEDADGAVTIASGVSGGLPMSYTNVDLASDSEIAGSDPLMVLAAGANFSGLVAPHDSTGEWGIRCVLKVPSAPGSTVYPFGWYCSGTLPVWRLAIVPGSPDVLRLEAFNASSVEVLGDTGVDLESTDGGFYDRQLYVEVNVEQNGADVDWSTTVWYNHTSGEGRSGTEASVTAGTVTGVALTGTAGATGATLGHLAVTDDVTYGATAYGASGFAGETTNSRLVRLAAELDIGWGGVSTRDTHMGAQPKADVVSLLREVEAAEAGVLYEARSSAGIIILPREDRENRDVELVLDFDQGHIAAPFEPTDDDFSLRNDVEVTVPDGTSGRYVDADHAAVNGVYDERLSLNLYGSEDPAHHASWRVHLGTVDDLRYPQVALALHRNTSLIEDWLACDIGSRLTIDNPPAGLPPDLIDVHVEGYTETLGPHTWDVVLHTSPAEPWQVATVEDGLMADTASALLVDYAAGDTSLLIAHPTLPRGLIAPPLWSTTAEPYDFYVAGERVTCTAMATNLITYVGAGTAATGNNASVAPTIHASSAKGDLMLLWAAIRLTSATVGTPSGWQRLQDFGNSALFGKIHDGSESSPTVTFAGGAAGDDTIAQTATFRGAQLEVQASATSSNASAQNITTPALTGVDRNNMLIIYAGWKQDDASSVTSPGTAEIGETSATAGNDALLVWSYTIQTTVTEIAASAFTVTGGANAVSKGMVVAIKGDVQTATVTRAVNGVSKAQTTGTAVRLWRPPALAL